MNHSNLKKFSILAVVTTLTIAMTLSPMGINHNTNMAFAGGDDHHDDDDGGNSALQAIVQSQSSEQNSFVVSGDDTKNSGNNFNFQNQENKGDNTLAQE